MSDEKTEEATEKKKRDARKKGDTANTTDFVTGVKVLAGVGTLTALGGVLYHALVTLVQGMVHQGIAPDSNVPLASTVKNLALWTFAIMIASCVPTFVAVVVATVSRLGLVISMEKVTLNLSAINPASGIKKMLSKTTLIEFGKSLLKAIILTAVLYKTILDVLPMIAYSIGQPFDQTINSIWLMALHLCAVAAFALFILGLLDVKIQDYLHLQKLKMTKDEVKREHKEMDGNQQIKGERKKLHREILNEAPIAKKVGLMDFVVVNPTHFSVAVKYDPAIASLPIVCIKGADEAAFEIRESALELGVPVISNPPLARALFRVDEGDVVPDDLIESVAGILKWIRQIKAASIETSV